MGQDIICLFTKSHVTVPGNDFHVVTDNGGLHLSCFGLKLTSLYWITHHFTD